MGSIYYAEPYDQDGEGFFFDSQEHFYERAEENKEHGIKPHPNNYTMENAETGEPVEFSTIPTTA